jgi:hypothetical protein
MMLNHVTLMAVANEYRTKLENAHRFDYERDPLFQERGRDRMARRRRPDVRIRRR